MMGPEAVFCVECGYDTKTGKRKRRQRSWGAKSTLLLAAAAAGLIVISVAVLWHLIHRDSLPREADRQIAGASQPAPSPLPETAAQSAAVPELPELRDPPSEGEVYQILRRVADAYRTIASY